MQFLKRANPRLGSNSNNNSVSTSTSASRILLLFFLVFACSLYSTQRYFAISSSSLADKPVSLTQGSSSSHNIVLPEHSSPQQQRGPLTEYDLDPNDLSLKYFVYQPSGGWGNQRMILRWAMRAANAMDRTLIVPNIAPHNMMWYGYDRINASDSMHADQVLEMKALAVGVNRGVRVYRGHLRDLNALLPGTWYRQSTPSTIWLKAKDIQAKWKGLTGRVVFWRKGSMWECCGGGTLMSPYIVFSQQLRELSYKLAQNLFKGEKYNAAHVRRGGGHIRIERRSAGHFLELKLKPQGMLDLPLYVATDERNMTWFEPLHPHVRLFFWKDVHASSPREVDEYLASIPAAMKNDAIGFLEQLICARANEFAASDGSTFSYAIISMRTFPNSITTSRNVDWKVATQTKSLIGATVADEEEEENAPRTAEEDVQNEDDLIVHL